MSEQGHLFKEFKIDDLKREISDLKEKLTQITGEYQELKGKIAFCLECGDVFLAKEVIDHKCLGCRIEISDRHYDGEQDFEEIHDIEEFDSL